MVDHEELHRKRFVQNSDARQFQRTVVHATAINRRLWICRSVRHGSRMWWSMRTIGVCGCIHHFQLFNVQQSNRQAIQSVIGRNFWMWSNGWFGMALCSRTGMKMLQWVMKCNVASVHSNSQVSHHPPMAAIHCEGRGWSCWQEFTMTSKFRGKYLQVIPLGTAYVEFKKSGNRYGWRKVMLMSEERNWRDRTTKNYLKRTGHHHYPQHYCWQIVDRQSWWHGNHWYKQGQGHQLPFEIYSVLIFYKRNSAKGEGCCNESGQSSEMGH